MSAAETKASVFACLGLPPSPVVLAPLAGVSDSPFRLSCAQYGADLAYVEMLSATAINFKSRRTYEMMERNPAEKILGVQLTGRNPEEIAQAIEILSARPFDTIDINMGCPVQKVTCGGGGSAILKDPDRVFATVKAARAATSKPLSVKIRIGWDRTNLNAVTVAQAAEAAGAEWITVHGRTRNDDYGVPVDLDRIAQVKAAVKIPVLGNGNVFSKGDSDYMMRATGVDGVMVSRGALGNPWLFREIKTGAARVTLSEWIDTILQHLAWQKELYGESGSGAVCMRKHILWYVKGWAGAKRVRERITEVHDISAAVGILEEFAATMAAEAKASGRSDDLVRFGVEEAAVQDQNSQRFQWDPKFEMDRQLDRGVGNDGLPSADS